MTTTNSALPSPFGGDWARFHSQPGVEMNTIRFYANVVPNYNLPEQARLAEYARCAYDLSRILFEESERLYTVSFSLGRGGEGDLFS